MTNSTFQFSGFSNNLMVVLLLLFCAAPAFADLSHNTTGLEEKNNPAMVLTCPNDTILLSDPGECGVHIDYSSFQWSSSMPVLSYQFEPEEGMFLEYGFTVITLTVINSNGTQTSCTFNVLVQQTETPLICQDAQFINLADSCYVTLTADMVLAGGSYACNEGYEVDILSPLGMSLGPDVNLDMVGNTHIIRVTDIYNSTTCFGTIIPSGDYLPQTISCPADLTILCNEPTGTSFTGVATFSSCFEEDEMELSFNDVRTNTYCDGDNIAFDIVRTWKVESPYSVVSTCNQQITARRLMLTEILFPPDYDGTDFPPLACSATEDPLILADTSVTGIPLVNGRNASLVACHLTFIRTDSVLNNCGKSYEIMRTWEAFDYCEDEFLTVVQHIDIVDEDGPQFSIPDTLYASTDISVCSIEMQVPAIEVDNECSGFSVNITTPWQTLNTNGGTTLIPITASSPGNYAVQYTATDACGNSTTETTTLNISNETLATCPPDATITSDEFLENIKPALDSGDLNILAEFGYPNFAANCQVNLTEEAEYDVDICAEGAITRFFGTFESDETCTQTIDIQHVSDFGVEFPADITIVCENTPPDFGSPEIFNETGENITVSFTDEIFLVVPDACYKIVRTWAVANTCVTGTAINQEALENAESTLGLPYPDCDLDGDGDCDNRTFRDSWTLNARPNAENASQQFVPDTDPDSNPWDGYIVYQQVIKVQDTIVPEFNSGCDQPDICISGNNCTGNITLAAPQVDECTASLSLTAQLRKNGIWQSGFVHNNMAPGTYEVRYVAQDNCNNQAACTSTVTVVDCAPPTPVCNSQQLLQIQPGNPPSFILFAPSLNAGSSDNCGNVLQLSFSQDVNDQFRALTCDDLGQNLLQIWVTDDAGNQATCDIFVLLEDNQNGLCGGGGGGGSFIAGNIHTEEQDGINNVEVLSEATMFSNSVFTDADGNYETDSIPGGPGGLTISCTRDDDQGNGVTTFDALLIIKHVLGTQPITSPYKQIAGDVNKSNNVSTFDALEIRKLVLGNTTQFPNNPEPWRFVPTDYVFPDPLSPFSPPFPEVVNLNLPFAGAGPIDFVGIKAGDVNGSASTNFSAAAAERHFTASTFSFPGLYVKKGQSFSMPLNMPEAAIQGFQFALRSDPAALEIVGVEPGVLGENSFGKKQLEKGVLKTSWVLEQPLETAGKTAFTLHCTAKKEGPVSDFIQIDEAGLPAESYTAELEIRGVQLFFAPQNTVEKTFQPYPNRPDPFAEGTVIPFEMPQAGEASLVIFDASGRRVKAFSAHFAEGYQEMEIPGDELPGAGIYFYQMRTAQGTAEGRMVKN